MTTMCDQCGKTIPTPEAHVFKLYSGKVVNRLCRDCCPRCFK